MSPRDYFIGTEPPQVLGAKIERTNAGLASAFVSHTVMNSFMLTENDIIDTLFVDATNGPIQIQLPTAQGYRTRRVIKVDSSANTVTVVGTSRINGVVGYSLSYQYEYVRVYPAGSQWLIISRGTLTPSFNSITFPSTQVPSSDPNTLDDYEEGTWTPDVGGDTTYLGRVGTYTKIGRQVSIVGRIQITTLGTGSSSTISGLPFAPSASINFPVYVSYWTNIVASFYWLGGYTSGSTIVLTGSTGPSANITAPASVLKDDADIIFGCVYNV